MTEKQQHYGVMTTDGMEVLSAEDLKRLDDLEAIISKNFQEFYDVGMALMEIRDRRLYLKSHATWDHYLLERWDMSGRHGNRLIQATETVKELVGPIGPTLGPIGPTLPLPTNEAQVRPLLKICDPEEIRRVWQEVIETAPEGKITAAHVNRVVQDAIGGKIRKKAKEASARVSDDGIDEEFKAAFDNFLAQVVRVAVARFETIPKAKVKFYLRSLEKAIV